VNQPLLKGSGLAVTLTLIGFLVAYQFVEPAPPNRLILATGSPGGAYHAFGLSIQEVLATNGITLELRNSAGSDDNAALLAAETVDVALIQGGTDLADVSNSDQLRSLASLYYEPLWIFHRLSPAPTRLTDLADRRVNRGAAGSGTQALVNELLALNGISGESFSELDDAAASLALRSGELDVTFMVGGESSPNVQSLLHAPDIAILDLPRAAAYHLHRQYLSPLNLPAGAIDLAEERPPADRQLIGVTAMLVARDELHPALVDLLLLSAQSTVGGEGLFHSNDQFPSGEFLSIPLDEEAERFHERGPSFLQRYLPFWAATLIDRMVVMLIPLAALAFPLLKLFPPVYRWRVRSRIYRWYSDLRQIERRLDEGHADTKLLAEIELLEDEVKRVETPLSYTDELYHLRNHIDFIRDRIDQNKPA
jgi:TRAP transporter TAXI family solute receptor